MEIVVDGLTHVYDVGTPFARPALREVTFHLPAGSFVGIIGATGSGKSTLIQHFNGLLLPTVGEVRVGDVTLRPGSRVPPTLRQRVGLVFQYPEHQLFAETVEEDVAYGPRNFGWPEDLVRQRVREALEAVGLDPDRVARRSPFALSGGEKRRVALAGVLAAQPEVLVLDEPTAGLDPRGRNQLVALIRRLHREEGMTVIWVTHTMEEVAELADRLLVLQEGRLVLEGSPAEVFSRRDVLQQAGIEVPEPAAVAAEVSRFLDPPFAEMPLTVEALAEAIADRFARRRGRR